MKIATVSEDGITISRHFGRAPMYVVMTVEDGKVVNKEMRMRGAHNTCACGHDAAGGCHESHGTDAASQDKHASMASSIDDCQVLIAGGMGYGAYEALKTCEIQPIVADVEDIDEAVGLFLKGKLDNLMERLH